MLNLHLIAFGGPKHYFYNTLKRLENQAIDFNIFKSINIFSDDNVFDFCNDLLPHKNFLYSSRGFGYWLWKYFIVHELMKKIQKNDIVLYLDAGCTLNKNALQRMIDYYNESLLKENLVFQLEHKESKFTKKDTFNKISSNIEHYYTNQICATAFFLKNTERNNNILTEIKHICVDKNYFYINDESSIESNDEEFISHRCDQSVFSLIAKKYNFNVIKDETYWGNWNIEGKNYPIWATRIKN